MAGRVAALSFLLTLAVPAAPLAAQQAEEAQDASAEPAAAEPAPQAYGPQEEKPRCDRSSRDPKVITVCGHLEEQSQFRMGDDEDHEKKYAQRTMNRGAPRVPSDVIDGDGIFKGPATVSGVCGIGLNPCPPPPALIIDLEAIPEAPEGSDADLIGKGEKAP